MTSAHPKDAVRLLIERRPLALAAACYVSGAAFAFSTGVNPYLPLSAAAVMLFIGALRRRAAFLFAAAVFLGAAVTGFALRLPEAVDARGVSVSGRVALEPVLKADYSSLTLDSVTLDGTAYPHKVRAYVYGGPELRLGDIVTGRGSVYSPSRQKNPGEMDFALWLWKDGIGLCASIDGLKADVVRGPEDSWGLALLRVREAIGEMIDRLFPRQPELVRALVIGDKAALPEELRSDFRASGVAHVLAVSGLHIGCLAFFADWLLRRLNAPYRAAYAAVILGLLLYAALVGFGASVVRAALMYALGRGARLSGRASDGITGLSAALLVQLLVRPLCIVDYGFILSFSAVAGLMLLMPVFQRILNEGRLGRMPGKRDWRSRLKERALQYFPALLLTSAAAQISTFPAVATLYGSVSAWSIPGNLLAIPLTLVSLPLCIMSIVLGFLHPALGQAAAALPDAILSLLVRSTAFLAGLPFSQIRIPAWPPWLSALYALACVLCSEYMRIGPVIRRWILLALPGLFCLSLAVNAAALPKGLSVAFLSAGHADAAVVHAEGRVYLVDVGNTSGPADDYLRYYGIGVVEGIFLSHPHKDHAAGLREVLEQAFVRTIYVSARWDDAQQDEGIAELLSDARSRGTRIVRLAVGDTVELTPQIVATVLHPDAQVPPGDGNTLSMVVHLTYEEGAALFLADLPAKAERLPMPDVDVMKVAHHGSGNATSEMLVRTASPSVAVISCGRNAYGHPAQAVVDRIEQAGAALYRTDRCGTVTARIYPDGMVEVNTFLASED